MAGLSGLLAQSQSWRAPGGPTLVASAAAAEAAIAGSFESGVRRGSGGGTVRVGEGSVWVQLALPSLDAFGPCPPDRLLNRHVRPLLRALTKASGVPVSYFGRDWLSAEGRPVAAVSFAHEARTGRALVEAIVAVTTPLVADGEMRPSFRGKAPATLAELRPSITLGSVIDAVLDAWPPEVTRLAAHGLGEATPVRWTELARVEDAIGPVVVARDDAGHLRVGGALMASCDAITALEETLVQPLTPAAIDAAVEEAFASAVVFGVRRSTIAEAIAQSQNIAWSTVEK